MKTLEDCEVEDLERDKLAVLDSFVLLLLDVIDWSVGVWKSDASDEVQDETSDNVFPASWGSTCRDLGLHSS
jgi:hypothetical protein